MARVFKETVYYCLNCERECWRESLPREVQPPDSFDCPMCGQEMKGKPMEGQSPKPTTSHETNSKDIIFARTRYNYDSYVDYWSLVELAGFPTCFVDEVDLGRNAAYVVSPMNGEWKPHVEHCWKSGQPRNARLVQWNLERPEGAGGIGGFTFSNQRLVDGGYFDEVWVSDRSLARITNFRYAVLGSDGRLGAPGHHDEWDVIHLCCPSHKRVKVWSELNRAGITIAPPGWGAERHRRLLGSRFMLNVHKQDDGNFLEPLRLSLAAAYALPTLTEVLADPYPYAGVEQAAFSQLAHRLAGMLREDYGKWRERGRVLWETMTGEFGFRWQVERMFQ